MSDKTSPPAAEPAAGASSGASPSSQTASGANANPKKPSPQNPALRMMGLPRLRLPSRNWMIFLSITGSFAGAVIYDKWQTRRMREKWCNLVSHVAEETLDTKVAPRKITIYLSAPPGDGLRSAREHFHKYVKPVLVSAAMDWDVVEGRKEGDVRHKTSEKIRKQRRKNGEGLPSQDEEEDYTVESLREKNGYVDYPGVAGDLVIGRNTWKEYIRGIHEGYLGPADPPKQAGDGASTEASGAASMTGESQIGGVTASSTPNTGAVDSQTPTPASDGISVTGESQPDASVALTDDEKKEEEKKKEEEEEKPKRRFPPSYILPGDYETATLSRSTPDIIGPSVGIRMPHLLGIRNTPIRIYRFLTRRRLQDDVGRQVAAAILSSHRPYGVVTINESDSASTSGEEQSEQKSVLEFEEKDWWKSVREPRKEHEESIWIEPMTLDERIVSRMRAFELTSEDESRAKRMEAGQEKTGREA